MLIDTYMVVALGLISVDCFLAFENIWVMAKVLSSPARQGIVDIQEIGLKK